MKELILTGYEKFWPKDILSLKNAIFLGPWCFAKNSKCNYDDQVNFKLAKPPWNTWNDLGDELKYIENLALRLIPEIGKYANKKNKVSQSIFFWQKVFLPWIIIWLQNYYDRYKRIENSFLPNEKYTVKIARNRNRPSINIIDFIHGYRSHIYNLYLMSSIIKYSKFKDNFIIEEYEVELQPKTVEKRSILSIIWNYIINLFIFPILIDSVYGINPLEVIYFQLISLLRVKKLKIINKFLNKINSRKEIETLEFSPITDFEEIVFKELWNFIPEELLIYQKPKNLKKLIIGNNYYNIDFLYSVAHSTNQGGKWYSFQHGGGYGEFKLWPQGFIEYFNTDGFLTWGWNYHLYPANYIPLASPMLSKINLSENISGRLIFVSTMHPPYFIKFHSALLPEQQLDYINNSKIFFENLEKQIYKETFYRPYPDQGQGALKYLKSKLPLDRILDSGKLMPLLRDCKLVVVDHLSTTFHETFIMKKPTIMFWDPSHFGENDHANHYFNKLRKAGILFDDPKSAASKVNEVWDDIDSWWESKKVSQAIDEFCIEFSRTSSNWKSDWSEFISTELKSI